MEFLKDDFEMLIGCPWCGSNKFKIEYKTEYNCEVARCKDCNVLFAKKRLNNKGLDKYWEHYLSQVHVANEVLTEQRKYMYKLEYNLINKFIHKSKQKKVLDVGCSGGKFLDLFNDDGYKCFGVEFGKEAAQEAARKYKVWYGVFPDLNIEEKFDLIIFRGVMQYTPNPKKYLEKASSLLNKDGYIYITSTPNMDSYCSKLFKYNFKFPIGIIDFIGFQPEHFINYFKSINFKKVAEHYFYEETPYANVEEDILLVAKAIELKKQNKEIDFKSPPFWGNMMSLIFKK
ncbi:class I SAM-dependent methyltransferase [Clostridium sporogenes]|uniref:class I SAM-dependent methyltransferase n=1 Tax=Clostridium sporogenes TaxID=1509 RepID=UPI0013C6B347|nr:class I SAM-dependent methyltransferase [Clostridium sporogenes]NFQ00883.1 class I SAM-dependent methyltransferase [Clostridium sporogenes]NFQ40946.1 class I SAM-dependent methyltransferase [Clostridium sporogenes]